MAIEHEHVLCIAIANRERTEMYDGLVIPLVPIEQGVSTAGTQYHHFSELFLKFGQWMDAMRVVYALCHSAYGYRRRKAGE